MAKFGRYIPYTKLIHTLDKWEFFEKINFEKNKSGKTNAAIKPYVIEHAESNRHICKVVQVIFTKSNLDLFASLCVQSQKNRKNKGGPSRKRTKEKSRAKSQ